MSLFLLRISFVGNGTAQAAAVVVICRQNEQQGHNPNYSESSSPLYTAPSLDHPHYLSGGGSMAAALKWKRLQKKSTGGGSGGGGMATALNGSGCKKNNQPEVAAVVVAWRQR